MKDEGSFGKSRQRHWYVRVDTGAEATDQASDNELRQSKCRALQDSADRHKRAADEDCPTPSENLTKLQCRDRASKATEIVARDSDTCHVSLRRLRLRLKMYCTLNCRNMTILSLGSESIACLRGANLREHLGKGIQGEEPTHYTLIIPK